MLYMEISLATRLPASPVPEYARISIAGETAGSPVFDDVYFSDAGGYLESEHVFIRGNRLPERLSAGGSSEFVIGETGFGTGRNLLVLMKLLRELGAQGCILPDIHFITMEKYPLRPEDLRSAQGIFRNLSREAGLFQECYRIAGTGIQTMIPEPGLTVHLIVGDVLDICPALRLSRPVNAWFLDGFAPSRNPDMWSLPVMRELFRMSAPGTTLATYTVSGTARRNLNAAGFATAKIPGFGRKREMMVGEVFETVQPGKEYLRVVP